MILMTPQSTLDLTKVTPKFALQHLPFWMIALQSFALQTFAFQTFALLMFDLEKFALGH